jgi:hypothetical protein
MIDISKKGFKLLSEKQISVGSELLCVLHLPEIFNDRTAISFVATTRWSSEDDNPDHFVSGYHIKEIEPDGPDVISVIMHYYGHKA